MQALNLSRAALVLAAVATAIAASADTLTYNFSLPTTTTDWTKSFTLGRFNPALGNLLSVEVGLTGSILTDVTLSNMSNKSTNTITGHASGEFVMTELGTNFTVFDEYVETTVGKAFAINNTNPKVPTFDGVIGQAYDDVTASDSFTFSSSNPLALAYVTGLTDLSFSMDAYDASYTGDTAGNFDAHYSTNASALGYIKYNYQPVPEPASMAALGLGALGVLRRRFRKGSR